MTIQAISKEYCGSVGRLSPTHQTHDGDFFPLSGVGCHISFQGIQQRQPSPRRDVESSLTTAPSAHMALPTAPLFDRRLSTSLKEGVC